MPKSKNQTPFTNNFSDGNHEKWTDFQRLPILQNNEKCVNLLYNESYKYIYMYHINLRFINTYYTPPFSCSTHKPKNCNTQYKNTIR